ncbi:DUF4214 domain-containing protein, partial [Pseudoduganella namucuonensis]
MFGNAVTGSGKEAAYVNVATGNLVVQHQDEFLASHGIDLNLTRTYNSLGNDGNGLGSNWRVGMTRQVTGLTGAANTAGSTVTLVDTDGSGSLYTYDAALGMYRGTDGGGAYRNLSLDAASQQWTWTSERRDQAGMRELYDGAQAGRITDAYDQDGNRVQYKYNASGTLDQVIDASGDILAFDYTNGNLSQVRTITSGGTLAIQVRYAYDALNRLETVTTDLSPEIHGIAGETPYVTTYTYRDTSNQIASIAQSDGTKVSFTYLLVRGAWRVATMIDGNAKITTFDTSIDGKTTVTDPYANKTVYSYDSKGQLLSVTAPATATASQVTTFTYDGNGNVTKILDARGQETAFDYDANGNRVLERDAMGNTVTRSYDLATNKLLTETRYLAADPDGAGAQAASQPLTTHFVYDASTTHLRFTVSPAGRVQEYRYDGAGLLRNALEYAGAAYSAGAPTLAALAAWAETSPVKNALINRSDYDYDRGLVKKTTSYAMLENQAVGAAVETNLVYDQHGQLRLSIDGKGNATSYAYDGLGRLLSTVDALGNSTTTIYEDLATGGKISTTQAGGLVTSTAFDRNGRAIQVTRADKAAPATVLSGARNVYDSAGRLVRSEYQDTLKSYHVYDAAGRQSGEIDLNGYLTEYFYNPNDQVTRTTRYATPVTAAAIATLFDAQDNAKQVLVSTLRPVADSADVSTWNLYDKAGRLTDNVDASGALTHYDYDGASRLVTVTLRATLVATASLAAVYVPVSFTQTVSAADRISRTLYDADGKLVGKLDPDGLLTENFYDGAGMLVKTVTYATAVADASRAAATVDLMRPAATAADLSQRFLYNSRHQQVGVIDGYNQLTETRYDAAGNVERRIRYATPVATPAGATIAKLGVTASAEDRAVSYTHTARNQLETETDQAGIVTRYAYDAEGNVVETSRQVGGAARAVKQRYDLQGRLTEELNAEGAGKLADAVTPAELDAIWRQYAIRHTYNKQGLRASTTAAGGARTLFYYDNVGRLTHTVNGNGEVAQQKYDAFGRAVKSIRYATPIDAAKLATLNGGQNEAAFNTIMATLSKPADHVEAYYYDNIGRLRYTLDGAGTVTGRTYNRYNQVDSTIVYGGILGAATVAAARGGGTTFATTDLATALAGTTGNQRTLNYYDAKGRLSYTVNAMGEVEGRTYDDLGQVGTTTQYAPRVNAALLKGLATEAATLGKADAGNRVQAYSYNPRGQVIDYRDALGNHTLTSYNNFGEAIRQVQLGTAGGTAEVAGADSARQTIYGADGRVLATIDNARVVTAFSYDAAGNVTERVTYGKPAAAGASAADIRAAIAAGTLSDIALDVRERQLYDVNGRASATLVLKQGAKDAQGAVSSTWSVVRQVYDRDGNPIERIGHAGTMNVAGASPTDAQVLAWLDAPANRTPRDTVQRMAYDKAGRLMATATALRFVKGSSAAEDAIEWSVERLQYDAFGNVSHRTVHEEPLRKLAPVGDELLAVAASVRDAVTRYAYDGANRVIATATALGLNALGTQQWAITRNDYDAAGNLTVNTRYANALVINEPPADLKTGVVADAARDRVTRNGYDAVNRLQLTVDASGAATSLVYDSRGNLVQTIEYVTKPGSLVVPAVNAADRGSRTLYDLNDRPVYTIDPMGAVTERSYDNFGNVTAVLRYETPFKPTTLAKLTATSTAATVANLIPEINGGRARAVYHAYGQDGRLRYSVDDDGSFKEFKYDTLGRVVGTLEFLEPLTGWDHSLQAIAPQAERQTQRGQALFASTEYDNMGNVVLTRDASGRTESFQYNAAGRITEHVSHGTLSTAGAPVADMLRDVRQRQVYDASGRPIATLVLKQGSKDAQGAISGDWSVVRQVYDADGNLVERIGHATAMKVAGTAPTDAQVLAWLDDPANRSERDSVQRMAYDKAGRLAVTATALRFVKGATSAEDATEWSVERLQYNSFGDVAIRTLHAETLRKLAPSAGELLALALPASFKDTVTRYAYDGKGRVSATASSLGLNADGKQQWAATRSDYDAFGNLTSTTRHATAWVVDNPPADLRTGVALDAARDRTTRHAYDTAGRRVLTIDATGAATAQVYDSRGNVAQTIEYYTKPSGVVAPAAHALDRVTRTVYDMSNQPVYTIDALGAVTERSYDIFGNVTTIVRYDKPLDAVAMASVKVTATEGDVNALLPWYFLERDRITRYAYDQSHNLRYTIDAEGYFKEIQYDALGRAVNTLEFPERLTGGDYSTYAISLQGHDQWQRNLARISSTEYDNMGNVRLVRDAMGATESFQYDALGRKTSYTNKAQHTWTYEYDQAGRLVQELTPRVAVYDGGLATTMGNWGVPKNLALKTRLEYDTLNNLVKRTEVGYDEAAAAEVDATRRATEYLYDALGRRTHTIQDSVSVYDPSREVLSTAGSVAALETHSGIRVTTVTYDTLGNAIANVDVGGAKSYKAYDKLGRVRYEVDANRNVTGYERDTFGAVTTLTRYATALVADPLTTELTNADLLKVKVTVKAAEDRTIRTAYDALGRTVKVSEPLAALYDQSTLGATSYITAGKVTDTVYNAFGEVRMVSVYGADAAGKQLTAAAVSRMYYNVSGRLVAEIAALSETATSRSGYLNTYEYDPAGNLKTRIEYSDALETWDDYTYGQPADNPAFDRKTGYTYDALNRRLTESKYGVTYTDNTDAATTVANATLTTSVTYDAAGNRVSVTDALKGATYTYYDALGRVTAVASAQSAAVAGITNADVPLTEYKRDLYGNAVLRIDYATGAQNVGAQGYTELSAAALRNSANRVTASSFDQYGRAIAVMDAEQYAQGRATTRSSYDRQGRVAKQWRVVTDSDGAKQTAFEIREYDALGRTVATVTPGNVNLIAGGDTPATRRTTGYNAFGEVVATAVVTGGAQTVLSTTTYDQAGNAWLSNAGDGVYRVTLFDAFGRASAQLVSTSANAEALKGVQKAADAVAMTDLMRTETRYDMLGRVVDTSLVGNTALQVLQREGMEWRVATQAGSQTNVDAMIVVGRADAATKVTAVKYRVKGAAAWLDAGAARLLTIDNYKVFLTTGLASNTYEYKAVTQSDTGVIADGDSGLLSITAETKLNKNVLVMGLYLLLLNRAPDPQGLNYWVGRANTGISMAQLAADFLAGTEGREHLGTDSRTIIKAVFRDALNRPESADPAYLADIEKWVAQMDKPGNRGQAIADLLNENQWQLQGRLDALLNYLVEKGGSDAATAERVLAQAKTDIDGAKKAGTEAAQLEQRRAGIVRLYIALFGSAPEGAALTTWTAAMQGGATLAAIADALLDTPEAQAAQWYPKTGLTAAQYNQTLITRVHQALLQRDPTAAELTQSQADIAQSTPGGFVAQFIEKIATYGGTDAAFLAARTLLFDRVAVGLTYAHTLQGNQGAEVSTAMIAAVTSAATAQAAAVAAVANANTVVLNAQNRATALDAAASAIPLEDMRMDVARLYTALLNRAPEKAGMEFWLGAMRTGNSLAQVAQGMINADQEAGLPAMSDADFITHLYRNVTGAAPTAAELANMMPKLAQGRGALTQDVIAWLRRDASAASEAQRSLFNNKAAVGVIYALDMAGEDTTVARDMLALVTASDLSAAVTLGLQSITPVVKANAMQFYTGATQAGPLLQAAVNTGGPLVTAGTALSTATIAIATANRPTANAVLRAARLYVGLLKRGQTGYPKLDIGGLTDRSRMLLAGESDAAVAQMLITSPEGALLYPPAEPWDRAAAEAFVATLYLQVLGREPDAAGLAYWTDLLPGPDYRGELAAGFIDAMLNSTVPDTEPGKAEELRLVGALHQRVSAALTTIVNEPTRVVADVVDATAKLNAANTAASAAITPIKTAATLMANPQAVDSRAALDVARLFTGVLNRGSGRSRALDMAGLAYWTGEYQAGYSLEDIADDMLDSDEGAALFAAAGSTRAFVEQIYQQVLGRAMTAADGTFWEDKIDLQGYTRGAVAVGIIDAAINNPEAPSAEMTREIAFEQAVASALLQIPGVLAMVPTSSVAGIGAIGTARTAIVTAEKNVVTTGLALEAAQALVATDQPAVITAATAKDAAVALLEAPERQELTELYVAFRKPLSYTLLKTQIAALHAGTTSMEKIAGSFLGSLPNRDALVKFLYSTVLLRTPDQAGYDYWMAYPESNFWALSYRFVLAAKQVEFGHPAYLRAAYFDEVTTAWNANQVEGEKIVTAYDTALATAQATIDGKISTATRNLNTAVASVQTAQDDLKKRIYALAVFMERTNATASTAERDARAKRELANTALALVSLDTGREVTTLAELSAAQIYATTLKTVVGQDATLSKAQGDYSRTRGDYTQAVQNLDAMPAAARHVLLLTQVYTMVLARAPNAAEILAADHALKHGKTMVELIDELFAANPTVYPAGMANSTFIIKLYANSTALSVPGPENTYWNGQLPYIGKAQMVLDLIDQLTHQTATAGTNAFNTKVRTALSGLPQLLIVAASSSTIATDTIAQTEALLRKEAVAADAAAAAKVSPLAAQARELTQLYTVIFGRTPDRAGLQYWMDRAAAGAALDVVAQDMLNSAEGKLAYPATLANRDFIVRLYSQGLDSAGVAEDITTYTNLLAVAGNTRGKVALKLITDLLAYSLGNPTRLAMRAAFMSRVGTALALSADLFKGHTKQSLAVLATTQLIAAKTSELSYLADGIKLGVDTTSVATRKTAAVNKLTLDRWGNLLSVADARDPNWKIRYTYNYDNRLIEQTVNALDGAATPP